MRLAFFSDHVLSVHSMYMLELYHGGAWFMVYTSPQHVHVYMYIHVHN